MYIVAEQPVEHPITVLKPAWLLDYLGSFNFFELSPHINEDNILTLDVFHINNLSDLDKMLRTIARHAVSGEMELLVYTDERPDMASMWLYRVTPGRVIAKKARTVWETVVDEAA